MRERIQWGIIGTGGIAGQFAAALAESEDGVLAAVASRDRERAAAFAARHGEAGRPPRIYDSTEALARDDAIDVVYVATPHHLHCEQSVRCLNAGRAVLCEKPLALNAVEARQMVGVARRQGRFLMEAMWSRYLPSWQAARRWIADGRIGTVRQISATFGFRMPFDATHRLFDPHAGGGSLLDVGVYPLSLTTWLLGLPDEVVTRAVLGASGVDEQAAWIMRYADGAMATHATSIQCDLPTTALISGSHGSIRMPEQFYVAEELLLTEGDGPARKVAFPLHGSGYRYEIEEVHRALRAGQIESETMRHEESIAILALLDEMRRQIGLRYPADPPDLFH